MRLIPWVYDLCRNVHADRGKVRVYLFKDERVCEICLYNRIRVIHPEIVKQVRDRHKQDHPNIMGNSCIRCDDRVLETWFWSKKVPSQFKQRRKANGQ